MYDIFYISDIPAGLKKLRIRFPFAKHARTLEEAKSRCFTNMFWAVWDDVVIKDEFNFDYQVSEWDQEYIHVFKNDNTFDGICLMPKTASVSEREFKYRFFLNKKDVDIVASTSLCKYDIFIVDSYTEYLYALENSTTEMFWMTSKNIVPVDGFNFDLYFTKRTNEYYNDRNMNHAFIHLEDEKEWYDGIFLCSLNVPLSKKEIEFRFPVNRKEWNIIASSPKLYDKFIVDSYEDYINAFRKTSTEMFWMIPAEVEPATDFNFDLYYSKKTEKYKYERSISHTFKNSFNNKEETTGSIMLLPSSEVISKREIDFRFLLNKIEHDRVISKTKFYDVIFISYNEPNADSNYELLKLKVPHAKRVHGVKGIHQAHIKAAELSESHMFWVVDGDAIIEEDFNFDYLVTRYERDIVHTWHSKNPMNDLVYGYGGVKLLPKSLTLNMDITSPDMTTAISRRFKLVDKVSNITSFNTDPFNTWKSAFRECVKLASKSIQGQIDAETEERLNIWCTVAKGNFAINAIRGAREGRLYGEENAGNLPALSKINDFEWLEQQFKLTSVLR